MPEEIKDEEITAEVETETVDSTDEVVNTDTTEDVEAKVVDEAEPEEGKAVPYKRFKDINDKYKAVKAELEALKGDTSQQTNEAETETTEVVETEDIVTDTTIPADDKVSRYEAVFNQMFTSKMEQVPEAYRDLIPEGDDLAKMSWIESAISKGLFTVEKPKDFGGLGANPTKEEAPDSTGFIRSLGRKFN